MKNHLILNIQDCNKDKGKIEHAIQPKQFKVLPDIFTTCPDLKDIPDGNLFKMFTDEGFFEQGFHEIDKTGDQDGSSGSKENDFDVNEKIINPYVFDIECFSFAFI